MRHLVLVAALLAGACEKKQPAPAPTQTDLVAKPAIVDVSKLSMPALFANVPADTPYMVAAFEAISLEYYAKMKRVLGPAFNSVFEQIRSESGDGPERVIEAIGAELAGKWDAKGLESLGFNPSPRFALYGLGISPVVFRIEVRDDKAVLATIERIAQRAGHTLPALQTQDGRPFWRLQNATGDNIVIVALADQQLVLAMGRVADIDRNLALIVGGEKPQASMADGKTLTAIMAKHGFGPHMVGFVDTSKMLTLGMAYAGRTPPPACTTEIARLASRVPRMVFGYSLLSTGLSSGGAIIELAPDLVTQLEGMRAEVPGLTEAMAGKPMFAVGIGANFDRARELVLASMTALRRLGEACEIPDLVETSASAADTMTSSIPRPVRSMTGVVIAMHDVVVGTSSPVPEKIEALVAVTATDPKALFAELSKIPQVDQLGIKPDGRVHPVQGLPVPIPFHAGIGDRAIAFGVGATGKSLAEAALAARPTGKAPFLLMTYDYGKFLELQSQISRITGGNDPLQEAERKLNEGLGKLFGRAAASLDVNKNGLAFWGTIEMK